MELNSWEVIVIAKAFMTNVTIGYVSYQITRFALRFAEIRQEKEVEYDREGRFEVT